MKGEGRSVKTRYKSNRLFYHEEREEPTAAKAATNFITISLRQPSIYTAISLGILRDALDYGYDLQDCNRIIL